VSSLALTPLSLADRRDAIAAALRAVRDEAPTAVPDEAPATPTATQDDVQQLRSELQRLADRVERVEDKVDLIRDGDDTPLAWPVPVYGDSKLEVPPLEVSRANSPAFDVLLGSPSRDTA
jgi:hypothetical protein